MPARAPALPGPLTATPLCEHGAPWMPEPMPATEPLVDLTHRRLLPGPLTATPLCEQGPPWKPEPVPATDPLVELTHRRLLLGAPAPSPAHRRVTAKQISSGHDPFEHHGALHGSRHDGSTARHPRPCRRGRRRSRDPITATLNASKALLGCQTRCPPPIHWSN